MDNGAIKTWVSQDFDDYKLLDSGNGRRLEKYGEYVLDRPDPQVIWPKKYPGNWVGVSAVFKKTKEDKGEWIQKVPIPGKWRINYKNLSFWVKLTPFKHTGIFPEQSVQWDYIQDKINSFDKEVSVLNLFGYTGAATVAAAKAGAKVTHVDASKPAITWANENRDLNGLKDAPIRWIVDGALEFTEREVKRENKYDAIILDPPVYGHGPKGEVWNFEKDFYKLMENCSKILSDKPLFVLVNTYAVSLSSIALRNTMENFFTGKNVNVTNGELCLKEESGRLLSTGIWSLAEW